LGVWPADCGNGHAAQLRLAGEKTARRTYLEHGEGICVVESGDWPSYRDGGSSQSPVLSTGGVYMHNEFTAIIEKDGEWYVAYCPEIPGANGQGRTIEECRESLAEAITLILEDRREDMLRVVPADAMKEMVVVQ
jgi:predicted RNase H-like HicB family nuclease